MRRHRLLRLIAGFKKFKEKYFKTDSATYFRELSSGQNPKTLIIACSDSRVDPALLSSAEPGDIFVVRNVANLVPPYESALTGFHGVSAAIEFAVCNLKVETVVLLGHRQCGGIRALMSNDLTGSAAENSFIKQWMKIALPAKARVLQKNSDLTFEEQCQSCEMESIVTSIQNLKSFPFVQEALAHRNLEVYGIYFNLETGDLLEYDEQQKHFHIIQ